MKKNKQMKNKKNIELGKVESLTPHNEALFEAGKDLLVQSIATGRDFCKDMIKISTSGIPIYLGLLKFILPEEYELSLFQINTAILPAVLFFIASIVFTIGYFPKEKEFSLDDVQEIDSARKEIIKRRMKFIWIGSFLFSVGIIITILLISNFLDLN